MEQPGRVAEVREAQAMKEPTEKVPTPEQLESCLRMIDRSAAREGLVRTVFGVP
jgi:hypothetical protein